MKNKPIFKFPLSFSLVQPHFFAQTVAITIVIAVQPGNLQ
jgi:hypothetical protein